MSQLEHEIDELEEGKQALDKQKEQRNKNAVGLVKNPNTRPKVIFTAVALVISAAIGLVVLNKGGDSAGDEGEASFANPNVRGSNSVTLQPSASQAYNDLKVKDNEQKAKDAAANGDTHIELPVTAVKKEAATEEVMQPSTNAVQQQQAPMVYTRDVAYDTGMKTQFDAILEGFKYKAPASKTVQRPTGTEAVASSPVTTTNTTVASNAADTENNFFIKAGQIPVGTIDLEANSDEPGEILATIRTGDLKGAKAICNFTKGKEALKLKCPLVSPPWGNDSFAANILLVDPETNRADMATEVDRHYMERYGLILASSFVQGLGEAAIRANSVISTSPLGSTQTQGAIDASDTLLVAAGRAGAAASSELSRRGDIPVTVKVKAGQSVGFLFLTDFKAKRPQVN